MLGQITRWLRRGVTGGVAALGLTAFGAPALGQAASGEPILVGHFGCLTGSEATFGISTSNGIRMAIEEFNAKGGLGGRPVKLVEYDTRGDDKEAGAVVQRLINNDKVVAVLGEVASNRTLAGAAVAQAAGIPLISPSSTNERVTAVGDKIFRVCFIDQFQGYACAVFAHNELGGNAALLYDQSQSYSAGLAEEFKKNYAKLGGKILVEQSYNRGAADFTAQLTAIRNAKPDVIFVPGYYTDVGSISIQARRLGITAPLLGGDGWDSDELGRIGRENIEGSFYSNHYAADQPDPRLQDFIAKYKAKHGAIPDALAGLGYDSANLLFDAMKRAPSQAGDALAAAIAATKDFPGVTGSITINAKRDASKPAVIVELQADTPGQPPRPRFVAKIDPPTDK